MIIMFQDWYQAEYDTSGRLAGMYHPCYDGELCVGYENGQSQDAIAFPSAWLGPFPRLEMVP